jgi:hypothetical protein
MHNAKHSKALVTFIPDLLTGPKPYQKHRGSANRSGARDVRWSGASGILGLPVEPRRARSDRPA